MSSTPTTANVDKVVLAYSGGLDTSIILKWLQETYEAEVVTFTADLGQGEEVEPARAKALEMGVPENQIYIDDLREEFVRDFVFPMFRANTIYEGEYLLGTSIARPLIAKRLVEIAVEQDADAIGKGTTAMSAAHRPVIYYCRDRLTAISAIAPRSRSGDESRRREAEGGVPKDVVNI